VEIISEFVTLKKAGRNYVGLCPFHQEKTPSFTVSPERKMYYCFGCGEGGNIIHFLMKMKNMTFPETIRSLAKRTGVLLPERNASGADKKELSLREQLLQINEMASQYFSDILRSSYGKKGRDYLVERGIHDFTIETFRLGYATEGWHALAKFFVSQAIPPELVAKAGLLVEKEGRAPIERFYDLFRGRLIFPIEDEQGRVVAFGGRLVIPGEPKYLNTPETPLYTKGRYLYGLSKAREGVRRFGYALLVEGYFDLLSLWNVGITNCVATLGTALTKEQVELIKRYTEYLTVVFDPDEAGIKALERNLRLFLSSGLKTRVVVLPEGLDPDAFVRKYGREAMVKILREAPSLVDYYVDKVASVGKTLEEKRDAAREAIDFISTLEDPIEKNLFLKKVAERIGLDEGILKREATATTYSLTPRREMQTVMEELPRVELNFILCLLEHPYLIEKGDAEGIIDYLLHPRLKSLAKTVRQRVKEGGTLDNFLDELEEEDLKGQLLRMLIEEKSYRGDEVERYFSDITRQIKRRWYAKKDEELMQSLKLAQAKGDEALCRSLLLEKEKLLREKRMI